MNPTQCLSLTSKGVDEVKSRAYKLNMKLRSVLILLERPQSIQHVLEKAIIPRSELTEAIEALLNQGFIQLTDIGVESSGAAAPRAAPATAPAPAVGGMFIDEDIILSEARFLMVNFCVDVFGTNSQKITESLGNCKSVSQFAACAKQIYDLTQARHPEQMQTLQGIIKEINQTAA